MKIEVKMTPKKVMTFEEHEVRVVEQIIKYCYHRLNSHPECGLQKCITTAEKKILQAWIDKL